MRTAAVCLVVFAAACSDDSPSSPVAPTNPMAPTTSGFMLSGTVRDSRPNGPALAGATVRLDTGQSTVAGSDGHYRFQGIFDRRGRPLGHGRGVTVQRAVRLRRSRVPGEARVPKRRRRAYRGRHLRAGAPAAAGVPDDQRPGSGDQRGGRAVRRERQRELPDPHRAAPEAPVRGWETRTGLLFWRRSRTGSSTSTGRVAQIDRSGQSHIAGPTTDRR